MFKKTILKWESSSLHQACDYYLSSLWSSLIRLVIITMIIRFTIRLVVITYQACGHDSSGLNLLLNTLAAINHQAYGLLATIDGEIYSATSSTFNFVSE